MTNPDLILAGLGTPSLAHFAPAGTTLPADATSTLAAAFKDAGICAASGADIAYATESTGIDGYGLAGDARTVVTKETLTVKTIFRETNLVTQAVYRKMPITGAGSPSVTSATGALSVTDGPTRSIKYVGVLHTIDGLNIVRKVFPNLRPTGRDNEAISKAQNMAYGVTFTAEPDADGITQYTHYILNALKTP